MPTANAFETPGVNLSPGVPCLQPLPSSDNYLVYDTLAALMNRTWNGYEFDLDFNFEITNGDDDVWILDYDAVTSYLGGIEPKDRICGVGNNIACNLDGLSPEFMLERNGTPLTPIGNFFQGQLIEESDFLRDGTPTNEAALVYTIRLRGRRGTSSTNQWEIIPPGRTPSLGLMTYQEDVSFTIGTDTLTGELWALDSAFRNWAVTDFNFDLQFTHWTY